MLTSYIIGTQSQGYPHFNNRVPSIFDIQEFVEHAWDIGINPQGRLETGGVRGTRKYIGTPEVSSKFDLTLCLADFLTGTSYVD